MTSSAPRRKNPSPAHLSLNWPLWLGLLLIGLIAYLAAVGPTIAPKDPLEENLIVRDESSGEWFIPPFPAFTVKGFPLGSDEFGRDLLSRLLYAVRPTFQMVFLVAVVRLVLGTLIGLIAGYSTGRLGKFFDSLISSALALPALLVALGAIAIIGVELGVAAFVIGLSITGWAETARLVREQTRTIRSEIYVEASHALGATDPQIVFLHVIRQIRAMLIMLFAFEVGSTLMLTAGLGFLGYYIGGDVWVDVEDFVARRTSGTPELGQMLATAWVRLTDPWGLVAVGSVVFAAVLGFNLIGEGLRLRVNPEVQVFRFRWLSEWTGRVRLNLAQILYPVNRFLFGSRTAVVIWVFLIGSLVGYGFVSGWQAGIFKVGEPQVNMLFNDRQPTPTTSPSGTGETAEEETSGEQSETISAAPIGETASGGSGEAFELPTEPIPLSDPVTAWTFTDESGFSGTPAVDSSGNIYVASQSGMISALQADGTVLWQQTLAAGAASSPVRGPDDTLYVTDKAGGLTALSPDGTQLWAFQQPEDGFSAVSQAHIGPDGTLYYTLARTGKGLVQAIAPDGAPRWQTDVQTANFYSRPSTSASGDLVFLKSEVFDAITGEPRTLEIPVTPDWFFVGENGKDYFVAANAVFEWSLNGDALELGDPVRVSGITEQATGTITPQDVFVTPAGDFIFFFRTFFIWQNALGELQNTTGAPNGHILTHAIPPKDGQNVVSCGQFRFSLQDPLTEMCLGFDSSSDAPLWRITFGTNSETLESIAGLAHTPTGFVLSSEDGSLYGVMERSVAEALAQSREQSELQETTITATGSGWIFTTPSSLLVDPILAPDGGVFLLTTDNRLYAVGEDGLADTVLSLPAPVYIREETTFGGGVFSTPLSPITSSDGTIMVPAADQVYAINRDGEVLWEFPLNHPPEAQPVRSPSGDRYYLIDEGGSLYAFTTAEGLMWMHEGEDGLRPVMPFPVFGPAGEIYYLVTFGMRGEVRAVSAEGEQLWRTQLNTFNFYEPIRMAPSGEMVAVDEDLIQATTGELIELSDTEFAIDQFAFGLDGRNYLLSGNTIMEWTLLPGGRMNVVRQITFADPPSTSRGVPPDLSVSGDGKFQILFFRPGGRSAVFDWLDFDGTVLNQINTNFTSEFVLHHDLQTLYLSACSLVRDEGKLICRAYDPSQQDPLWEITIQGIQRANSVQYRDGVLFIQTQANTVQTVQVDLPPE